MLLLHVVGEEGRRVHCLLVMGKLWSVGVLLGIGVGNSLVEGTSHGDMVGEIGRQSSVEVGRTGLKMSGEPPVLHGQIIIFFLVHLLVDHVLFGDS